MLSCFGCGREGEDADHEPLLPQYNDETALQTRLHEKLHTYQMLRALTSGYMPSNEQVIIHLRSILAADVLNPERPELSSSGRALVRTVHIWIKQFIDTIQHKNSDNGIQNFLWHLAKARLEVDTADISSRASATKAKADVKATLQSLQTLGSLLLTNSDFRIFLADVSTIGKEIFHDTALSLSEVSRKAGKQVEPSEQDKKILESGGAVDSRFAPSTEDLEGEAAEVLATMKLGAAEVVEDAKESATEHIGEAEYNTLTTRLKHAVTKLRQRRDYSESASVLSQILYRYLSTYSHAASDTMQYVEEDVSFNQEAHEAIKSFWKTLTCFGHDEEWKKVEESFKETVEAGNADPNFDSLLVEMTNAVQEMLTDPAFYENTKERLNKLHDKFKEIDTKSSISEHIKSFFDHLQSAIKSAVEDDDVRNLGQTTKRLIGILSPSGKTTNEQLIADATNIFIPLLIQAIQYFPIPRLEVSTPSIDLLVENLILEPGKTVNHSSFLPYKLLISTQNDMEIRKARFQTVSSMTSLLNVKISGLSIAAEDLGYWLRLHSGLLRMVDEGLAGFYLDERGIDISLDIEIGRERIEEMVTLHNVDVKIHHLNYSLSKSKLSCLAWILKPFIRPIVRKALEAKMAAAIAEGLHTLNRELLFARERLRATRIANPQDLWTFIRAVAARLVPAEDPDVDARVGLEPGAGIFRGRYAPGSLARLWANEAQDAGQRVFEGDSGGWRNDIFDVKTRPINTWRS